MENKEFWKKSNFWEAVQAKKTMENKPKVAQNSQKWPKVAKNTVQTSLDKFGQVWTKVAKNSQKWPKNGQNVAKKGPKR